MLAVAFRPPEDWTLAIKRQDARKFDAPPVYDVVVAGDSRTQAAVAPSAMRETFAETAFSDVNVLNFAFAGTGFSPSYMDDAAARLVPDSPVRAVVLGITPRAFHPVAFQDNSFQVMSRSHPLERAELVSMSFLRYFDSMGVDRTLGLLARGEDEQDLMRYFKVRLSEDGWVASTFVGNDEALQTVVGITQKQYRETFREAISQEAVAAALSKVRAWTSEGIRVYGFRPPTSPEMLAIEGKGSGFDEEGFIREFGNAGGRWLAFPDDAFPAYDTSHLDADTAWEFSRALATAVWESREKQ